MPCALGTGRFTWFFSFILLAFVKLNKPFFLHKIMFGIKEVISLNMGFGNLFTWDVLFLICIGIFWLVIASIQDFKKREVQNWWTISFLIVILMFRAFLSVQSWNIWPFAWGLIGLALGIIIANILYYARMFAAGDFKLLIVLFSLLPLSHWSFNWKANLLLIVSFFILFLLAGAVYGVIYTVYLSLRNKVCFKREFSKQIHEKGIYLKIAFGIFIVLFIVGLVYEKIFIFLGGLILLSSWLLIYAKAVENGCMIKRIKARDLTYGDWLAKDIKLKNRLIKPNWEGLDEKDLRFIQKYGKNKFFLVKDGIPFVPAFFLGFIFLVLLIL